MCSPDHQAGKRAQSAESANPVKQQSPDATAIPAIAITAQTLEVEDELEADDGYADSAYGTDYSDTTSVSSSIYNGFVEHGRRYQATREGEYYAPSDQKQFESLEAAHIVYMIMDSRHENPLFRAPIPDTVQNILDIGTGTGTWPKEVADRYPSAFVHGVDLYPPPDTWVPPNCKLEVDDVLKTWTYPQTWDFIHIRDLMASFSNEQWRLLYKQAYNNLTPGGWIEQVEPGHVPFSDDNTIVKNGVLDQWGATFTPIFAKMNKPIDTIDTFKSCIEAAGFINVHEKLYKVPLGEWVKSPVLKEAGRFCKAQLMAGMEGYTMWALTKFGEPEPWSPEEVQVYLAEARNEVNAPGLHAYYLKRRVWAQKPFDAKP